MTTIAFKDGIMAADTQTTWGDVIMRCQKMYRTNVVAVGISGNADHRELLSLVQSLTCEKDVPNMHDLSEMAETTQCILYFFESERTYILQTGGEYSHFIECTKEPFVSVGSGCEMALGAMAAGVTAKEAVKAVCSLHVGSSAPINIMKVY